MTGTLSLRARRVAAAALAEGALVPLASERFEIPEANIPFVARILFRELEKRRYTSRERAEGVNPFLPYDPKLFVAELSRSHVCLLNKFPVVADHLLVVTRAFVDQAEPLDAEDLGALYAVLADGDGVGFYNSGPDAGGSQPHKHLQVVPAPLGAGFERFPTEPLFEEAADAGRPSPALPFAHAAVRLREPTGACALEAYRSLRARLRLEAGAPYNVLATRELLALVPRGAGAWGGVGVNALGFAGSLLVMDRERLDELRRMGPLAMLSAVGIRR